MFKFSRILLLLCCFFASKNMTAQSVWWQMNDSLARVEANKSHKLLAYYFATGWCGYCKKMKQTALQQEEVKSYLNKYFVLSEVNAEAGGGKILAQRYGVSAYPTIVVVDEKGTALLTSEGYQEAADLLKTMGQVVKQ